MSDQKLTSASPWVMSILECLATASWSKFNDLCSKLDEREQRDAHRIAWDYMCQKGIHVQVGYDHQQLLPVLLQFTCTKQTWGRLAAGLDINPLFRSVGVLWSQNALPIDSFSSIPVPMMPQILEHLFLSRGRALVATNGEMAILGNQQGTITATYIGVCTPESIARLFAWNNDKVENRLRLGAWFGHGTVLPSVRCQKICGLEQVWHPFSPTDGKPGAAALVH